MNHLKPIVLSSLRSHGFLVAGLTLSALLVLPPLFSRSSDDNRPIANGTNLASIKRATSLPTRPIEQLRVGDRVMAHNPEVSDAERASWPTPDGNRWLHLSLKMPLPLMSEEDEPEILSIELLRPEEWFLQQVDYVAVSETNEADTSGFPLLESLGANSPTWDKSAYIADSPSARSDKTTTLPLSPLRDSFRDLEWTSESLRSIGMQLVGLTVELDLPEMGASGTAFVTDIQPCPPLRPGDGQLVTATFNHPPSREVLDVRFEGEQDAVGVTDNHLFWSVDQQRFVAIGEMEIGEQVQTYFGDIKRIVSKLPRPGPKTVYNIEVYGEHVYYVGSSGLLAHNAYGKNGRLPKKTISEPEAAYRAAQSRARFEASAHTITLRRVEGMPRQEFLRKARALQELGEQGRLIRRTTPRDTQITKTFRQNTIDRIWAQYGQRNREFANKLIDRVTRRMSPDHVHELQLLGPDNAANLRWLDRFTNEHIGMRQIWPQIRSLPEGTPIRIIIE